MTKLSESEKAGTIHDAKDYLIEFFKYKDNERDNNVELDIWKNKRKAALKFNKIVREARERAKDAIWAHQKEIKNKNILENKEKVELDIPRWVRDALSNNYFIFKFKEFYLKEIPYDYINNKIKFHSGKDDFYFVINTGFKKHKLSYKKLKSLSVLSEQNLSKFLIDIYKKDVLDSEKKDKEVFGRDKFKKKKRVYDKINKVIEHNLNIATMDDYTKPLYTRDEEGHLIKDEGEYPMNFQMFDEELLIYIP